MRVVAPIRRRGALTPRGIRTLGDVTTDPSSGYLLTGNQVLGIVATIGLGAFVIGFMTDKPKPRKKKPKVISAPGNPSSFSLIATSVVSSVAAAYLISKINASG